jgi:hypothetical protein
MQSIVKPTAEYFLVRQPGDVLQWGLRGNASLRGGQIIISNMAEARSANVVPIAPRTVNNQLLQGR